MLKVEASLQPETIDMCLLIEHQVTLALLMAGYPIAHTESKVTLLCDHKESLHGDSQEFTPLFHLIIFRHSDYECRLSLSLVYNKIIDKYNYDIYLNFQKLIGDGSAYCDWDVPLENTVSKEYTDIRISAQQGEVLANETAIWLREQLVEITTTRN